MFVFVTLLNDEVWTNHSYPVSSNRFLSLRKTRYFKEFYFVSNVRNNYDTNDFATKVLKYGNDFRTVDRGLVFVHPRSTFCLRRFGVFRRPSHFGGMCPFFFSRLSFPSLSSPNLPFHPFPHVHSSPFPLFSFFSLHFPFLPFSTFPFLHPHSPFPFPFLSILTSYIPFLNPTKWVCQKFEIWEV